MQSKGWTYIVWTGLNDKCLLVMHSVLITEIGSHLCYISWLITYIRFLRTLLARCGCLSVCLPISALIQSTGYQHIFVKLSMDITPLYTFPSWYLLTFCTNKADVWTFKAVARLMPLAVRLGVSWWQVQYFLHMPLILRYFFLFSEIESNMVAVWNILM